MKHELAPKTILWHLLVMIVGGAIYGVGVHMFVAPNAITVGGATGVTLIINHFTQWPLGVSMLLVNIPLFLCSYKIQGKWMFFRTLLATVVVSVMIDLVQFVPAFTGDKLLAAIYGGAISGLGLGMFLAIGVTTGGSDLLAKIIQCYVPHMSMGVLIMGVDVLVVIATAIVYRDVSTIFYSVIVIVIASFVLDKMLAGLDFAKLAIVISDRGDLIAAAVLEEMGRGVTGLDGKGWYSGAKKGVLLCVLKRTEIFQMKTIVHRCDSKAFLVFVSATEVYGEGFKNHEKLAK